MVNLYQFLKTKGLQISFVVAGVLCVLSLITIIAGLGSTPLTNKEMYTLSAFDFSLYISYFLFIIAVIVALVFPTIYFAQNIKDSKKLLILIPILLGIFLVCYLIGSSEIDPSLLKAANKMGVDGGTMKLLDTLLYVAYFLFFLSLAAIVFATLRPLFLNTKKANQA